MDNTNALLEAILEECMSFDLFVDFVLKPLDTFPAASA
jgi:hypothetical protein